MTAVGRRMPTGHPARLWLPVFALFTLHNLEEIILDLPAWGRAHGVVMPTTQTDQIGFALIIAGLSAVVFTLAYAVRRTARLTRLFMLVFLGFMLVNFIWHLGASVTTASLQPGTISSAPLIAVYGWLFRGVWTTKAGGTTDKAA